MGHFDCIGVALGSHEQMSEFVTIIAEKAEATSLLDGGTHYLARDSSGALTAVNVSREDLVECVTPSFAATHDVSVVTRGFIADPECRFCDRMYLEVVDEEDEMAYPLAAQLHDIAVARETIPLDAPARARLTGFAEDLATWPDEAAYEAAQVGEHPLAAESLIPTGLFTESDEEAAEAHVLLTGRILAADVKENGWTGGAFRWALVRTFGGDYELVAPMEAPRLEVSGIVQGRFWIVGTVVAS
jgi:hypothetical protein